MHFVVLHFMTWPHVPSIYSIDPSICPFNVAVWSSYAFFSIFFLSLSLSFTQDVIIRVSRKLFIILKLLLFFSFSLYLRQFLTMASNELLCNCNFVEIRKVPIQYCDLSTYIHILFAFDRTRSNSIWLTMKPSKFW